MVALSHARGARRKEGRKEGSSSLASRRPRDNLWPLETMCRRPTKGATALLLPLRDGGQVS